MQDYLEYTKHGDGFLVHMERDEGPFDKMCVGVIKKDSEAFYRFHPSRHTIPMTCKLLRRLSQKLAEMNITEPPSGE